MKAKLLLLILSFFFVEESVVAATNDATRVHIRIGIGSTPKQIPVHFPEDMPMSTTNILSISFDKKEDFVLITIINKVTSEVVYSQVHLNVEDVVINLSSFPKGQYLLETSLDNTIIKKIISVN